MNTAKRVILQAGGKGSRLGAISESTPKPLLEVAGRTLLERLVDSVLTTKPAELVVVTGYLGKQIEHCVENCLSTLSQRPKVRFIREENPLGNAGVLKQLSCDDLTTIFLFADLLTDFDFEKLLALHYENRTDVTLASHHETHQLSLGELVEEEGYVHEYVEKPTKKYLICSGIAVFSPATLSILGTLETPFGLVDVVNTMIDAGLVVRHWNHGARWIDINTPDSLALANSQSWA